MTHFCRFKLNFQSADTVTKDAVNRSHSVRKPNKWRLVIR
jgi:hypothetical protein